MGIFRSNAHFHNPPTQNIAAITTQSRQNSNRPQHGQQGKHTYVLYGCVVDAAKATVQIALSLIADCIKANTASNQISMLASIGVCMCVCVSVSVSESGKTCVNVPA